MNDKRQLSVTKRGSASSQNRQKVPVAVDVPMGGSTPATASARARGPPHADFVDAQPVRRPRRSGDGRRSHIEDGVIALEHNRLRMMRCRYAADDF
ncbi:hypothetical protein [Bradyrhizobium stylosanthis]|nr:hypothetical protein [Bradyrhizobium stylosanthis]